MDVKLKPCAKAILYAVAGLVITTAATAQSNDPQRIERVEVTGSNIKRAQDESPTAVQVITRREIEATGAATANEVFLNLPGFSAFNSEVDATGAPSRATVGFRQFNSDNVLVLINGRRIAKNSINASSYDLNSIPASAIERVEVLKDGASAIYGSDAIAGVVNIITRTNFQGVDVGASSGRTNYKDGEENRVSVAAGYGDLQKDKFNVLITGEYFKREIIFRRDRAISLRKAPGQYNEAAVTGNYTTAALGGKYVPLFKCVEDVVTDGQGTYCPYYFNQDINLIPSSERKGATVIANAMLPGGHKAFAELMYSDHDTLNSFSAPPGTIRNIPAAVTNGRSDISSLRIRHDQNGVRRFITQGEFTRIGAGLEGTIGKWDYAFDLGQSKNEQLELSRGFFNYGRFRTDVLSGAFPLFSRTSPATAADVAKYAVNGEKTATSTLDFVNLRTSSEIMQLPAGPLGVAVGFSYNKDKLNFQPDAITQTGAVSPSGTPEFPQKSSRTTSSVFVEFAVPIVKNVEAQVALRHDRYNDVGSVTTPKLALRWAPSKDFVVRGSYAEGFRAPALEELFKAPNESFEFAKDTVACAAAGISRANCPEDQFDSENLSNPNLKPEKSKSFAFGFVWSPTRAFSTSLDYYYIVKKDEIDRAVQFLIDNPTRVVGGRLASQWVQRVGGSPTGNIEFISNPLLNIADVRASGIEWQGTYKMKFGGFGVTLDNQLAYNISRKRADAPGEPLVENIGTINEPRYRNVFSVALESGPFNASVYWRTLGGFSDARTALDITPETRRIGTFETMDLQASYATPFVKGLGLYIGAKNVFNKQPAISEIGAAGFPESQSANGRFVYGGLNYKFR